MEEGRERLGHEKAVHLSHVVVGALEGAPGVELLEERNRVRLRVLDVIRREVKADAEMDAAARRKIRSLRREVPEGSEEWEVLYRQYYREEQEKRGR